MSLTLIGDIVEDIRDSFLNQVKKRLHQLLHLRVCSLCCSQLEDVAPFAEVGGHNKFGLGTVGEDRTSLLGRPTVVYKILVSFLRCKA